jgi:hypothetical protein
MVTSGNAVLAAATVLRKPRRERFFMTILRER